MGVQRMFIEISKELSCVSIAKLSDQLFIRIPSPSYYFAAVFDYQSYNKMRCLMATNVTTYQLQTTQYKWTQKITKKAFITVNKVIKILGHSEIS